MICLSNSSGQLIIQLNYYDPELLRAGDGRVLRNSQYEAETSGTNDGGLEAFRRVPEDGGVPEYHPDAWPP